MSYITDEMVEAAFQSWNGWHVGTAKDRLRVALEATEPMIEELRVEWYSDGYEEGQADAYNHYVRGDE